MKRAIRTLILFALIAWGIASLIPAEEPPEESPVSTHGAIWPLFTLPPLGMAVVTTVIVIALEHQGTGLRRTAVFVPAFIAGCIGLWRLTWWCADRIPADDGRDPLLSG